MVGERPQLYKIRRLVKREDKETYEWYLFWPKDESGNAWTPDQIDGFAFVSYGQATKICEHLKVKNKDPEVIYHSVVPA